MKLRKILDKNIELTATCVRITSFSFSLQSLLMFNLKNSLLWKKLDEALNKADGCEVY